MNFYIPFLLKDGDRSIYDLITSIVGAEGIAPTAASVFNGIETPRASPPLFTGLHPLNPFKDRLLVYDRLPLPMENGRYSMLNENAAYICMDADSVRLPEGEALREVDIGSGLGLTIFESIQAVLFSDPSKVSILFISPKMYDKCQGCRAGVNVKNEKIFGYRVMNQLDSENSVIVPDEFIDALISSDCFSHIDEMAYYPSWRIEALQGAALCYKLARRCAGFWNEAEVVDSGEDDWKKIEQFTHWLGGLRYTHEPWAGQKQLVDIVRQLKTLPSFVKKDCLCDYSRMDDFGSYDLIHRELIERFVDVAVSLKMKHWNWADNECRATLAEHVMDLCIVPVMRENFSDKDAIKKIDGMANLMLMIERRFREPNTYMEFDEDQLKSRFVRAVYRFLSSEGRIDRIQEYLSAESRLELPVREMIAAMYGAFKGYAQISVKRLASVRRDEPNIVEKYGSIGLIGGSPGFGVQLAQASAKVETHTMALPAKKSCGKKRIHKGAKNKQVSADEYERWLAEGWKPGYAKKSGLNRDGAAETQGELGLM